MRARIRHRGSRQWRIVGLLTALVMVISVAAGAGAAPASAAVRASAPAAKGARSVTGLRTLTYHPAKVSRATDRNFTPVATRWPAVSSSSVALAAPARGATAGAEERTDGSAAWLQAVAPASGSWSGPASAAVAVQPQSLSRELGIDGVVWRVSGLRDGDGRLRAGLDYSSFADAYGGNYGLRLTLVELPACALTTPQLATCRRETPLQSENNWRTHQVSGLVSLSGAARPQMSSATSMRPVAAATLQDSAVVIAATSATSGTTTDGGDAGTYGATSLKPSDSWTEGGSSGDFTYTYDVDIPSASSTLTPDADLTYDSGSVDGQTASTQAQADWAGDGWSTDDSYIEQSFVPCSGEPDGTTLASADQTGDMCYNGNTLTLDLNGQSTALVRDDSTGTWELADDDGATVSEVTGSGNGTASYNTSYWVVTERDGTSYYFGRNELPGWASGDATTDSVDTEPVYSPESGDPCYSSDGFTDSVCTMAYRWHLDYVTDRYGDAMAYYYHQDTNYYGEDNGAKDVSYVRDSYLTEIDYGFRAGDAYASGDVPDKIIYGTSARCVLSDCATLSSSNSGSEGDDYPDVPYDLNCASGSTCTVYGPTYWSTVRLTSITTEQYSVANSAYKDIDTYSLTQTEPDTGDGTSPTLWLAGITRTGDDTSAGGSSSDITLPEVTFTGTDLQNRVDTTNFPGLYRYRLTSITNETGGVIGITYGTPDTCTDSYVEAITTNAEAKSNTDSCYPVWWTPAGYTAPVMDWFEKYAVTQVLESDTTGGALAEQTDYSYGGGAAWHYNETLGTQAQYQTYGEFRGYQTVTTYTGDTADNPQTESVTSYYRGMSDDDGDGTTVTLTDSQGGTHTDADQLAGQPLETTVYNGSGGPVDNSTIYSYWVSGATATETQPGLPDLTATMVEPAEVWTRQLLTDGGTDSWRYTETDTSYDTTTTDADFGLAEYVYQHTVPVNSAYDRCTSYQYAPADTSENLVGLVSYTETDSVACSGFTEGSVSSAPDGLNTLSAPSGITQDEVVSAAQTFYDDTTFATTFPQTSAPTTGNVTMTRKAVSYSGGTFTWQTTARDTYDNYGRVEDAYDGDGNETITAYTVNSAGLTTAESVTNALGQMSSQTFDPTRDLELTSTDANGVVSTYEYDALGRVTSEWDYSRPTSDSANYVYTYTVSDDSVSGVTMEKLGDSGGYATTVEIIDSLGRERQTQTDTPQGGRLITDYFYDSRGWLYKQNNRYWDDTTTPAMSLVSVADDEVADQDDYTFNGLGEVVQDASEEYATTISTTTTVYSGDCTTTIPPAGGTVKTTCTDPLGRTSETEDYKTAPTLTTPSNTYTGTWYITGGTAVTTTDAYDGNGEMDSETGPTGSAETWSYNLLGEKTSQTDPDAGTTTMTYDGDGNLLSETDADGNTVSYTYDALGRKTAEYAAATADQSSSNELASWAYDNSNDNVPGMKYAVGQVTTETSYSGGSPYVIQSLGFNVFGESLGETVTIPSAAGGLAGAYTFKHTYTTTNGLALNDTYPDAGGLPAETVQHTYLASPLDLPSGLGGTIDGYAQQTTYDAYGDVTQEEIGTGTNLAYITNTYDPHTLDLTESLVSRTVDSPADVDEETYAYDADGLVTSQTDERLGESAEAETQCYAYDDLDRLTAAWTATDDCATQPSSSDYSMLGDGLGSSSEYWTTWTYGDNDSISSEVEHSLDGSTDTTLTDSYGGSQPDALTQSATTGASTATSTFGYDADGNMTTRDTPSDGNQTLSYNAVGELTSVDSSTQGTTNYVYDADGNLLLDEGPTNWTLYLPGEDITLDTTTSAVTGARIIPLPSGGDVVRTGATTSYYFEIPDQQGTNTLYLDDTAQVPTWRQFTPYGASRGSTVTWIDDRGFLNAPDDAVTGLTDLGARWYDPVTGEFISPDPLLDTSDPQDLDAYTYSEDDPINQEDPSGAFMFSDGCGTANGGCNQSYAQHQQAQQMQGCPPMLTLAGCQAYKNNPVGGPDVPSGGTASTDSDSGSSGGSWWDRAVHDVGHDIVHGGAESLADLRAAAEATLQAAWRHRQQVEMAALVAGGALLTAANFAQLGLDPVTDGAEALDISGIAADAGEDAGSEAEDAAASCGGDSFTATTKVLLASGAAVPIAGLKPGDKVLATNTKTGKTRAEPVAAVLLHHDTDLYDLTVKTARGTAVLDTTSSHLFWDPVKRQWVKAASLRAGEPLKTPGGATAYADGGTIPADHDGWMWDLTVPGDHDFYIDTVAASILVHNCDVTFRSDTSHIFRDAPGHLGEDTPENRALLQGAVNPDNLVGTNQWGISTYQELLPDGRQIWVEVRDGTTITNGGVNVVPRS
jgi:RHS repeat-associated protein